MRSYGSASIQHTKVAPVYSVLDDSTPPLFCLAVILLQFTNYFSKFDEHHEKLCFWKWEKEKEKTSNKWVARITKSVHGQRNYQSSKTLNQLTLEEFWYFNMYNYFIRILLLVPIKCDRILYIHIDYYILSCLQRALEFQYGSRPKKKKEEKKSLGPAILGAWLRYTCRYTWYGFSWFRLFATVHEEAEQVK